MYHKGANVGRNQNLAPQSQSIMEKPIEAYYLDKWFVKYLKFYM